MEISELLECLMNGTHDEYKISDIGFQNFYASMLEAKIYIILSLISMYYYSVEITFTMLTWKSYL